MQTAVVSFPAPLCRRESTQKAPFPSVPDLFPRKRGIMLSFHRPVARSSVKLLKITDLCLNPLYVAPPVLVTRPSTLRTMSTREPRVPFVYGCRTCVEKKKTQRKWKSKNDKSSREAMPRRSVFLCENAFPECEAPEAERFSLMNRPRSNSL